MSDDSNRGPETEKPNTTTGDVHATAPESSGGGGRSWTKSPSIWPEPIKPAARPDLWSPEARQTGPIPTATPPLNVDGATGGDAEAAATDSAAIDSDATSSAEAETATPERSATPEEPSEPLSYTGLFKAISDDDLDRRDAQPSPGVASDEPGMPTAPFDVPAELAAADASAASVMGGGPPHGHPTEPVPAPPVPPAPAAQTRTLGSGNGAFDPGGIGAAGGDGDGPGSGPNDPATPPRFDQRRALIVAGVVIGVLLIGYGIAFLVAGGSLARGATVAGIEVGGMTRDEARAALNEQLPGVVDTPISVTVDGDEATYELVPSSIGLTVDVDATVDRVPGASASPVSLVRALVGAGATTPIVDIEESKLTAAVADVASQTDTEPVNGSVAFSDGEVVTSEPVAGRTLDTDAAVDELTAAYYGGASDGETPRTDVTFPAVVVDPVIDAEAVQAAVTEFAEPAMSGPVTIVAGNESVDLSASLISQALTMTSDDSGVLQPALDAEELVDAASDELEELGQDGRDATIVIENGRPVVIEAVAGRAIAPEDLSEGMLPALTRQGGERVVEVELVESEPEITTAAAEELGVKQVVAEYTTHFPPARYRDVNIGTAAQRIDNTLLMPGDEFSLNGIVGERTEANGFTSGTIIDGGRLKDAMGGGVSQVATTTFHAAFLAGLEDVEHWPHSIYFDRYPIGQEATVVWGAKDLRFANDTPYGVLIDTSFTPSAGRSQGTLTVRIWSTKHYEVSTSVSERYSFTSPQTIYDTSDKCSAQGGSEGFTIDSFRTVKLLDGTVDKDEKTSWTYNPNHKVVCGEEPKKRDRDDD